MQTERHVFIYVCERCDRRHYSLTNSLAPFVQSDHKKRYFCDGKLVYKTSERAVSDQPRYVS